jgi:hypothetical protein
MASEPNVAQGSNQRQTSDVIVLSSHWRELCSSTRRYMP